MNASNDNCHPCPAGADCSHKNGIHLNEIVAINGYWRPHPTSKVFSDCRQGYGGTDKEMLAKDRCCPAGKCSNNTNLIKNGVTFNHTDDQCKDGYSGALCLVCANNYVLQGIHCIPCAGGSNLGAAFVFLFSLAVIIFFIVLFIFVWAPSASKAKQSATYFGQVKIILTFLQILASMPGVFDNVPWPTNFINFTLPLNIINMDFLSVFMKSTCSLSVPFLQKFILHMLLPVLLLAAILIAYSLTRCCLRSKKEKLQRGKELLSQILILGIFFLYPGLATQVFSVFRCKEIDGIEGQVLAADFSIKCHETEHFMFSLIAFGCLVLYIIGLPFIMFFVLYKNRRHLFDTTSKHHERVKASLGGLYLQYEEKYWW